MFFWSPLLSPARGEWQLWKFPSSPHSFFPEEAKEKKEKIRRRKENTLVHYSLPSHAFTCIAPACIHIFSDFYRKRYGSFWKLERNRHSAKTSRNRRWAINQPISHANTFPLHRSPAAQSHLEQTDKHVLQFPSHFVPPLSSEFSSSPPPF